MSDRVLLVAVLALFWGVICGGFLQLTAVGRFLAARRTLVAVIIWISGDLLILCKLLGLELVLQVGAVLALSSVGLLIRSLRNDYREHTDLVEAADVRR